MFAFILVLGIVVDDAIVVGENIFRKRAGLPPLSCNRRGKGSRNACYIRDFDNRRSLRTLLFVPGFSGKIFSVIPIIVIAVLMLSLVESLFILLAHLAHIV